MNIKRGRRESVGREKRIFVIETVGYCTRIFQYPLLSKLLKKIIGLVYSLFLWFFIGYLPVLII